MEFPSNSQNVVGKTKKEKLPPEEKPEKNVQKVVTGEVVQRSTPIGRRFKHIFFGGEFKGASRYILGDVLLPAFKNMTVDAVSKGVERMVYGDAAPRRTGRPMDQFSSGRPRFSYNQPSDRYSRQRPAMLPDQPPHIRQPQSRRRDAGEIILVSRAEAEMVLERLADLVDNFEVASVADLYELVGLPNNYVDNKWGWTNLAQSDIRQVREGFIIDLPPVEPI